MLTMFKITVPSFRKVENSTESHTVYIVEVMECLSGKITQVEKRFSEFVKLHKKLKKCISTPEFPPKKFQSLSTSVPEKRRAGVQTYLQGIMLEQNMPDFFYSFLGIGCCSDNQHSLNATGQDEVIGQPMVGFPRDAFLSPSSHSFIRDIIVEGVHLGLYTTI